MKWLNKSQKDADVIEAQRKADRSQRDVEKKEQEARRISEERVVIERASQANERRWRNHREPNGWNEIVEAIILSIGKKQP